MGHGKLSMQVMASTPLILTTPRDMDLLAALERSPLTVQQLLKLSATFAYPFTSERRVQERLQRLVIAGRIRQWFYATAGRGALSYYTLSPLGFRLLHGDDAVLPSRFRFGPVGVARQGHVRALADTVVHLLVAADQAGMAVQHFFPENHLQLQIGTESLYPDTAFDLLLPDRTYHYFIELDNCSETIYSNELSESWQQKISFYERLQDETAERFRVLAVTTGQERRIDHILQCAAQHARNPRRCTIYGTTLTTFLNEKNPLTNPCFRNHAGKSIALVPTTMPPHVEPSTSSVVALEFCREPLPHR